MAMLKNTVILLSLMFVLGGCAGDPKLPDALVYKHCPRQAVKIPGVRRAAIMDLKNVTSDPDASQKVMGLITAELLNARKFELVERSQIYRVMDELKLGMSGLVDEKHAKSAGRMLGADAVIIGEITSFQHEEKPFEYKYSRERGRLLPLPPGDRTPDIIGLPAETRTYTVEKYYVSVGFALRMIAIESGEIIWSRHVTRSFGMREGEYDIRNVNILLDKILAAAVREAVCDLSP